MTKKHFFGGGGGWPYWILPKGLTRDFEEKIEKSLFYCLFVEIKSKKMFQEIKDCKNCRKDAFLTSSILEVAILNFSKGVNL